MAFSVPPERPVSGTVVAILRHAAEATRASGIVYGSMEVPLDLVPFGGVEGPAGTVAWPPERAVVMSVVGFREAAQTAIPIVVGEALTVPVVALAALSLLKLTAWLDRHQETDKDAIDLLTLLRLYYAAGNEDRLYGAEAELLAECGFDPELAGARLLGRDAVRLCGGETVRAVLRRLPTALRRGIEDQMLRQAVQFDDETLQARIQRLLAAFLDELAGAARLA